MNFIIDIMDEEDLNKIMEIERSVFSNPWSKRAFKKEINNNNSAIYFTARRGREILAYIGFWLFDDILHITNLAVDTKYQKKGVATRLFNMAEHIGQISGHNNITLEVRISNEAAISFYKKMGFVVIDRKVNYYTNNNEDAFIMWKVIDNE